MTAPDIGTEAAIAVTFFPTTPPHKPNARRRFICPTSPDRIATTTAASKAALPWLKAQIWPRKSAIVRSRTANEQASGTTQTS